MELYVKVEERYGEAGYELAGYLDEDTLPTEHRIYIKSESPTPERWGLHPGRFKPLGGPPVQLSAYEASIAEKLYEKLGKDGKDVVTFEPAGYALPASYFTGVVGAGMSESGSLHSRKSSETESPNRQAADIPGTARFFGPDAPGSPAQPPQ